MKPIPRDAGAPIVGHLNTFRHDRIGMLKRLATAQTDIIDMPMGIIRHFVTITSPALANEVLVAKQMSFIKSPGFQIFLKPALGEGLLSSEAPLHEKQRKLLASSFAPKRVASYAATMSAFAQRFVDRLHDGERLDLAEAMMRLTFEIVGKTLFDTEVGADADLVSECVSTAMEVAMDQMSSLVPIPPMIPTPANLRYRSAVQRLDKVVYRVIADHRNEGRDRGDVLSMLIEARDDDGHAMTDRQIRDESMGLFLAGHETTANALSWTFYLLARNEEARARMEAELDALGHAPGYDDLKKLPYTLAVFKESMRLFPPVYLLGRRPLHEVTIGEHRIHPRSIVGVNVLGLHRRADLWPNPERFEPERFLNDREKQLPRGAYMPFGAGGRICIGNHFATMEGHILLATIARRLRFEPATPGPAEMEPLITLRPRNGLQTRVVVRH